MDFEYHSARPKVKSQTVKASQASQTFARDPRSKIQRFPLLDLPAEIRCVVYAHAFSNYILTVDVPSRLVLAPYNHTSQSKPSPTPSNLLRDLPASPNQEQTLGLCRRRRLPALLLTCHQIRSEALPVFSSHLSVYYRLSTLQQPPYPQIPYIYTQNTRAVIFRSWQSSHRPSLKHLKTHYPSLSRIVIRDHVVNTRSSSSTRNETSMENRGFFGPWNNFSESEIVGKVLTEAQGDGAYDPAWLKKLWEWNRVRVLLVVEVFVANVNVVSDPSYRRRLPDLCPSLSLWLRIFSYRFPGRCMPPYAIPRMDGTLTILCRGSLILFLPRSLQLFNYPFSKCHAGRQQDLDALGSISDIFLSQELTINIRKRTIVRKRKAPQTKR